MTNLFVQNPRTGERDFEFQVDDAPAVERAVRQVRSAQPHWNAIGFEGRAAALRAFQASLEAHRDPLVAALREDTGRGKGADVELGAIVASFDVILRNAQTIFDSCKARPAAFPNIFGHARFSPYQVVGIISPWNFPLVLSLVDLIPALAAGCAVVLKPSEVTPRFSGPLEEAIQATPVLCDVVRIVRGPGATGAALVDCVDAVVCTGSVKTGRIIAEHAGRRFIPAMLELGGKDAVIVTADADLETAARAIVRAALLSSGQACQSLERVYVQKAAYDRLLAAIIAEANTVRMTCDDPAGHIGPFIMERQADIVASHVEDAVAKGAKIELGGHVVERGGRWFEPTVLSGVNHTMKVMTQETFGPIIPVMPFDTIDEAINLANDSEFGLSANVLAGDEATGMAIAERLDAGFVSVGDISMSGYISDFEWEGLKSSGLGRARYGEAAIERYLRTKVIATKSGLVSGIAIGAEA